MPEKKIDRTPIGCTIALLILTVGFILVGVEFKGDGAWMWISICLIWIILISILLSKK